MANEITFTANVAVNNSGFKTNFAESTQYNQTAIGAASGIHIVTTSEGDLSAGDITTNGLLILKNIDSTNFITYGPKVTGSMQLMGKLKAGETAILRVAPTVVVRMIADTASCKVNYIFLND